MIIRRRHTANFTTIANVLFEDERLALDELGLMAWLRSRPNDWEVRRPALMRRFKVGRDGLRRIMRSLLRFGWMRAEVTRLSDGRVYIVYEVRDEPGPELTEDEARAALSLASSGAGTGESTDDDGEGDGTEDGSGAEGGSDPPDKCGSPLTGQPVAATRLRPSPPGPIEDSLKTDSVNTESPNGVRAFVDVQRAWPPDHILSIVACESLHAGLTDAGKEAAFRGVKPYLADCAAQSRKVCDLRTYYLERRWERFAGKPASASPSQAKPYTAQWHRWRDYRLAMGQSITLMESWAREGRAWSTPTEWPPALPPKIKELSEQDAKEFTN